MRPTALFALFAAGLLAQPRRESPDEFRRIYFMEPGGTPEDRLWQVLVLFGVGDKQPAQWDGSISLTAGVLHALEGYRTELPDRLLPEGGWTLTTRIDRWPAGATPDGGGREVRSILVPKGLLIRGSGDESTRVEVRTSQGTCAFQPMRIGAGQAASCLGGRAEVRRIPAASDLSGTELRQHDFPSIASTGDGKLAATWLSFHHRQEELNLRLFEAGRWTRLLPVPRAAADLWRPQASSDARGTPWLVWSQQVNGNWDIWAMPWEGDSWGPLERLSSGAGPDIEPHVARGADGTIHVVWMSLSGRFSQIRLRSLRGGQWSPLLKVTEAEANDWDPSIAAGPDGRVWIAWDRYGTSYDVYCRSVDSTGLGPEIAVAATPRFEAYASIAVDPKGRPWIAWEVSGANWGKDLGAALGDRPPGTPLGDTRSIEIAVLDGSEWKSPAAIPHDDAQALAASSAGRPNLHFDSTGSLWLTFHRRYIRQARGTGAHWETYLTRLEGNRWSLPMFLPSSAARQSTRLGITTSGRRLWMFWPSESRRWDFTSRPRAGRVIAGSIALPVPASQPELRPFAPPPGSARPAGHANEPADLDRIRTHRVSLARQPLRIVRGDLHRHTELSQDSGGIIDGSIHEFYRYMIDAANMDFGASTDHQAGGTDYWAFLAEKMADMYHFPQRFVPLYAYERNLGFPHGHRNIIHIKRGYPVVPFFQGPGPRFLLPDMPDGELLTFNSNSYGGGVANDTKLLYEELRKSGGIAIPHTSGSPGMGTDWRDNDKTLEPLVEIYQGDRLNYESLDAPRGNTQWKGRNPPGGFQEQGLVWNAWKKGYKIGVIASSDHLSTHISYAMVYTPGQDRQSIFEAIKRRHAYGATDNIVLEFWAGDHFMGDEFVTKGRPRFRVRVKGTDTVARVRLIRDAQYLHTVEPGSREAAFEYADRETLKGEHWYYVRAEQANGELAWSSPIWITYR